MYTICINYKALDAFNFNKCRKIIFNMNRFGIAKIIIFFSAISYLGITFFQNYNSPENIEKRCLSKFEKDFKTNLNTSSEEWEQILDLADNNYLKCIGLNQF